MKFIGTWMRALDDSDLLPAQEFVTNYEPETRQKVADYLDAGAEIRRIRGFYVCDFGCGPQGNCERTDGTWVWPASLGHEVRAHSVLVPEPIIQSALFGKMPLLEIDPTWEQVHPDRTYWKEWCAQHRSGILREQLAAALVSAEVASCQLREELVAEREALEGLSNEPCSWKNCHRFALKNRKICAACMIQPWQTRRPFYDW